MATLEIDHGLCIKSGECYFASPDLFKAGDEGFPLVLVKQPEGSRLQDAENAAYACPGRAITVVKDEGEQKG